MIKVNKSSCEFKRLQINVFCTIFGTSSLDTHVSENNAPIFKNGLSYAILHPRISEGSASSRS
jgi:hypothetical protein